MAKKRTFISFDYDHDIDLKNLLVGQARNPTRYSQWVPFEVGMSTQNDMPTATFLQENVSLPEFLDYWPRLKQPSDIRKYIAVRKSVQKEFSTRFNFDMAESQRSQTERFYDVLKRQL